MFGYFPNKTGFEIPLFMCEECGEPILNVKEGAVMQMEEWEDGETETPRRGLRSALVHLGTCCDEFEERFPDCTGYTKLHRALGSALFNSGVGGLDASWLGDVSPDIYTVDRKKEPLKRIPIDTTHVDVRGKYWRAIMSDGERIALVPASNSGGTLIISLEELNWRFTEVANLPKN